MVGLWHTYHAFRENKSQMYSFAVYKDERLRANAFYGLLNACGCNVGSSDLEQPYFMFTTMVNSHCIVYLSILWLYWTIHLGK